MYSEDHYLSLTLMQNIDHANGGIKMNNNLNSTSSESKIGDDFIIGIGQSGLDDLVVEEDLKEKILISTETKRKRSGSHKNPTLIIGLGGTGVKSLDTLKGLIVDNSPDKRVPDGIAFLGFDCDRNDINKCKNLQPNVEVIATTLSNPKQFKMSNEVLCDWVTQKSFPSNAEFGAGQYRQVSRMCLMHHFEFVSNEIRKAIVPVLPQGMEGAEVKLDVYIVSSICGGAGSGMFVDMAIILRDLEEMLGIESFTYGVFVTGDVYQKFLDIPGREHPRILANTYSCLKELQYLQDLSSKHNTTDGEPLTVKYPGKSVNLTRRPFDLVLLVQGSNRYGKPTLISATQLEHFLSNVLYLMSSTPLSDDHRSKWVNPASGYQYTEQWTDNAPRTFSSLGYIRYMYPEHEFMNYAIGYYGELLLKYFLDAIILNVPKEHRKDPRQVSIKDYIQRFVKKRVSEYYEYEDIMENFHESLSHFRFSYDLLNEALNRIVDNEDWDNIPQKIEEYESGLHKQLQAKSIEISNAEKKMVYDFDQFLEALPYILLENGIGVRHILQYFTALISELDEEESLCADSKSELEIRKETNRKEWMIQKQEISALIKEKPLWRRKSKFSRIIEEYSRELSSYLNDRLKEEIMNGILATFTSMDVAINRRMQVSQKIISKFDETLVYYQDHRRKFEILLKNIAGKKKAYSHQMEFSVVTTEQLSQMLNQFLEKNSPKKMMLQLFGRTDEPSKQFWSYKDARFKSVHLKDYIQTSIRELFKPFRMPLSRIVEQLDLDKENIKTELARIKAETRAQWIIEDSDKAGVAPINDTTTAFPIDFMLEGEDDTISTSDRIIEVLRLEYAIPSPMLTSIKSFKRNYDRIESQHPRSLHIFPDAYTWSEADIFPGKDDMLQLFALSCAFGKICKPNDQERAALDDKYGNRGYRGFIFQSGNWFILMPYYALPAHRSDMSDNPIKLGMGRHNAFQNFKNHPEYSEILQQWIEDRVIGRDISQTIEELKQYLDELDKEKTDDSRTQIENETDVIKGYLEMIEKSKTLAI